MTFVHVCHFDLRGRCSIKFKLYIFIDKNYLYTKSRNEVSLISVNSCNVNVNLLQQTPAWNLGCKQHSEGLYPRLVTQHLRYFYPWRKSLWIGLYIEPRLVNREWRHSSVPLLFPNHHEHKIRNYLKFQISYCQLHNIEVLCLCKL